MSAKMVKGLIELSISIVSEIIGKTCFQCRRNQARTPVKGLILLLISLSSAGCATTNHPIVTRVIDAQTGQPIEDAVVLVNWTKSGFAIEPYTSDYKSFEALTSEDGVVNLPGMFDLGVNFPDVFVYKRGYVGWQSQALFAENKTPQIFSWKNGYRFKLKRFEKGISISDHWDFIHSRDLPYKTTEQLYWKAINGGSVIQRLEKYKHRKNSHDEMRFKINAYMSPYSRWYSRVTRKRVWHWSDGQVKRMITGLYDSCSNQMVPLDTLAMISPENSIIQAYLPDAIEAIIDQWHTQSQYVKNDGNSNRYANGESNTDSGIRGGPHTKRCEKYSLTGGDLGNLGLIAAPTLQHALIDTDGSFRRKLIIALGYTGAPGVGDILLNEYNNNRDTRLDTIRAMGMLKDSRFAPLISAELASDDKQLVDIVTGVDLRDIRQPDPQSMTRFIPGLQHQSKGVRDISFIRLAYYIQAHDNETITKLLKLLYAPNPETRLQVIEILGAILNNDEVVPALIRATKDSNGSVQKAAITALGYKSGPVAHDALVKIYSKSNEKLRFLTGRALLDSGVPIDELLNLYEYNVWGRTNENY